MSEVSFVEFINQIGNEWNDALRVYANVKSPIEIKTKKEWEKIFDELKNKPISN